MDERRPANPYLPPESELNQGLVVSAHGVELAERGTRLTAIILDGLIISIPLVPMMVLGVYAAMHFVPSVAQTGSEDYPVMNSFGSGRLLSWFAGVAAVGCLAMLGIAIYQWILISKTGQSLGKKWTGIRIEKIDGSPVSFTTGVVLRNWVPKIMGAFPYLGMIFHLVDALYIFREDHRCLHDHIAGTRVVRHRR
jgi:uncharacterized RDD family membrane protein YckC